jgi:glycosyltransferase 2 family protein
MDKSILKKYLLNTFKIFVTLFFFIIILDKVDIKSTFKILKSINPYTYSLALLVIITEVFIASLRWRIILKHLGLNMSYLKTLNYLWIGVFFNQALPSSIGGDAVRGYYLYQKENFSINDAATGVLLDRIIGLLGLTLLVLFTMPLIFESTISLVTKWTVLFIIFVALLAIFATLNINLAPNKFKHFKIIKSLNNFSFRGKKVLFSYSGIFSITLSLIIHLIFVYAAWLIAISMGLSIPFIGMLLIVPITNLLIAIPISIAGWGFREGLFIAGLSYLNVPSDAALALSILYGLLMLIVSIPGLVYWILQKL